jgi:hypothetical protein
MTDERGRHARRALDSEPHWFSVVGHPVRIAILGQFLADAYETRTPRSLSDEIPDVSLSVVGYHVRQLREAGLLQLVRTAVVRGADEHHYRVVNPEMIAARLWGMSARMLRPETHIDARPLDTTVLLDSIGVASFWTITAQYIETLAELERDALARCAPEHHRAEGDGNPLARVVVLVGGDHGG